jgi:hypothetical protein
VPPPPALPASPAGLTPFWPQALLTMTGCSDEEGSELATAAELASELLQDAAARGVML